MRFGSAESRDSSSMMVFGMLLEPGVRKVAGPPERLPILLYILLKTFVNSNDSIQSFEWPVPISLHRQPHSYSFSFKLNPDLSWRYEFIALLWILDYESETYKISCYL
jgi:hypothetical protein